MTNLLEFLTYRKGPMDVLINVFNHPEGTNYRNIYRELDFNMRCTHHHLWFLERNGFICHSKYATYVITDLGRDLVGTILSLKKFELVSSNRPNNEAKKQARLVSLPLPIV
jgi:predicted transcriptional regulator